MPHFTCCCSTYANVITLLEVGPDPANISPETAIVDSAATNGADHADEDGADEGSESKHDPRASATRSRIQFHSTY